MSEPTRNVTETLTVMMRNSSTEVRVARAQLDEATRRVERVEAEHLRVLRAYETVADPDAFELQRARDYAGEDAS